MIYQFAMDKSRRRYQSEGEVKMAAFEAVQALEGAREKGPARSRI
jgi:hypothetical protein